MPQLRVRFIQANPTVGDLEGNFQMALQHLRQATDVDLLVFPECFLSGYPLQDLVLRPAFLTAVRERLNRLGEAVHAQGGPAVLMGAPVAGSDLPFNAATLLRPDGTRQTVLKTELPNNDVFDERRTFAMGKAPTPLVLGDWKIGALICEDMWHGGVARTLADEGAELLLVINGSPMELGKQAVRLGHARKRVKSTGLPLVYLNLTGGQDELVFDGSSFLFDAQGQFLAQAPMGEAILDVTFEKDERGVADVLNHTIDAEQDPLQGTSPVANEAHPLESLYWTLMVGLRDYVRKNGFRQVLLGLSGGLDSAIVAALAADALGPEQVCTLMLPAAYTGQESRSLAEDMAVRLGCRYGTVPILNPVEGVEALLQTGLDALDLASPEAARRLASENIQARVRGNLLMALSNAVPGTLVLSTGNKSEMSVGYATLYGDMCGGFNPIKDLYKTRVQALTAWRNANFRSWMKGPADAPIPERILSRPPTAELAAEQTDEASLGAYPVLDAVLEGLVEHLLSPEAAAHAASRKLGQVVEVGYAERIARLVQRAEYKRRQAPPGIKVTGRSFGFGWRFPLTAAGSW
jgi:NAD+ synthase